MRLNFLTALLLGIGLVLTMPARSHAEVRYFSQGGVGYIEITGSQYNAWRARTLDASALCVPTGEGDCNCPRGDGTADSREQNRAVLISRRQACPVAAGPCGSIVGEWQWPSRFGGTVRFNTGGTGMSSAGNQVTWTQSGATVTLRWPRFNTTDNLTLDAAGRRMAGTFAVSPSSGGATDAATRNSPCR